MIWLRLAIVAGILSIISGLGYIAYDKIKHIGYLEAEVKYTKIIEEHNTRISLKIIELERVSRDLVEVSIGNSANLTKNIDQIVSGLKGKTLTIIKDGKCTPTKEFSDSFGKINRTANESMQESRK